MSARLRPVETALLRGALVVHHGGETNRCPSCGGTAWHVGRSSAECARCEAAIPLAHPNAAAALPAHAA